MGKQTSTPPLSRAGRRAGRPSSSDRWIRDPSSPSTSRRPSLWVMEHLRHGSSGSPAWSMLLPRSALAGAWPCVMVLYHLVRRWIGRRRRPLSGRIRAGRSRRSRRPIFRSNDPDALPDASLWCRPRGPGGGAMETGETVGLLLGAALVGLAFLDQDARCLHRRARPSGSPTCGRGPPAPGAGGIAPARTGRPWPCSSPADGGWRSWTLWPKTRVAVHRLAARTTRART